jgi:hypothetical protein
MKFFIMTLFTATLAYALPQGPKGGPGGPGGPKGFEFMRGGPGGFGGLTAMVQLQNLQLAHSIRIQNGMMMSGADLDPDIDMEYASNQVIQPPGNNMQFGANPSIQYQPEVQGFQPQPQVQQFQAQPQVQQFQAQPQVQQFQAQPQGQQLQAQPQVVQGFQPQAVILGQPETEEVI